MRKGKFCPKCGKSVKELHQGLCSDCFLGKMRLPKELPEKLLVGTCKSCGNVYVKDDKFESVEAAVEKLLREVLTQKEVKGATYRIYGDSVFVTVDAEVDNLEKEMEKKIVLVNKTITCKYCNLQKSSFYNVTIQVRVPKDMEQEVLNEIQAKLNEIRRKDNYSFISEMQNKKEGIDLLIGSKGAAERVVKYLKQKYPIVTKISRKLYGLNEGKKVYRDTILVSMSD